MSKANNLKDFLVDLANAIREKKNKTGAINPQDFSAEIKSIVAGDVQMPNVSGTLVITEWITEEDYEALKQILGNNITIDAQGGIYIHFEDPEVLRVLLANITPNDGVGITTAQAEAVTNIGTWFKGNKEITRFNEFEKFTGVTSISGAGHAGAFDGCTLLETIKLPENITSLGACCFNGCSGLKSITLPDAITYIGDSAFKNCSQLVIDGLKLPNLKTVGAEYTFMNTLLSGELNLPSLSSVGMSSFAYTQISSVTSLGSLTTLPDSPNDSHGLFLSCTQLKSVVLPSTLTKIGRRSFMKCTALETIISDWVNITSIGGYAFYNCTSLSFDELNLPNLTSLGQNAFYGVKIKKLVLGSDGVALTLPTATTSTQNYGDKSVLEEVVLPDTVTIIPNGSFYKYTNCVIEDLNLPNLTSLAGGAFNGTKLRKITSLGEVTRLPNNANSTGGVFQDCIELTQIQQSVLDKLEYIAQSFQGCVNLELEELRLPNLTEISAGFANCNKIRRVMDLGKITRFFRATELSPNSNPFGTNVQLIILPESVESIGRQAFRNSGNSLQTVILKSTTPPSCALYWDNAMPSTLIFYVPDASVEAYKNASGWSSYADRIKPLSEYVES